MNNAIIRAGIMITAWVVMSMHGAQAQDSRNVFVNLDKVFNEYYKTKLADAQIKKLEEEYNERMRDKVTELRAMNDQFVAAREMAQDTAVSEDMRNRKRGEAEELLIELRERETTIKEMEQTGRKELESELRRRRTRIIEEIKAEIQRYARAQGYQSVIDSSGKSLNFVELIIYADQRVDITADIIALLNKGSE